MRKQVRRSVLPQVSLVGLGIAGVGWLMQLMPARTPGRVWWPWLVVAGLAVTTVALGLVWSRRAGSAGQVGRWSRRSRRNDGVASAWTILRVASGWAMRRKATVLRPSLAQLNVARRLWVSTREFATPLARVGWLLVWSAVEDVTLRIGGPRTGKTGELAGRILDAPGAVIATSTRTDLIELTRGLRSKRGPVEVFNPSGVGGLPSTITFDPLSGCEQPSTATSRASDLLSGVSAPGAGSDREFWASQARRVLASLMHAAALGKASMRDVLAWVADPDANAAEVRRLLRRSPEPAYESDALQFLSTNERTRSSICSTIMPALGWLTDSTAAAATQPDPSGRGFDVAALLERRGTVFMLGAEDAQVAPLVTALTGHVAREARRIAADQPGGRLDPPLTLALDEAALICPIPLDNWTADMGGRGVTIHIAVQSRAQLRQRWGDTGAGAIMNNAATVMVFGGTRDPDDLAAYSTLAGERDEEVATHDHDGKLTSISYRRVPVLSPAQIAQIPVGQVVIIRRGMPPAIGRVQMAWRRRDVRRDQRRTDRDMRRFRHAVAKQSRLQVSEPAPAEAESVEATGHMRVAADQEKGEDE
ncbi:type IV secretory system conjugative DNA transfer family protein [Actinopolymorpha pittospori]|uniref:Type IV secretory pathway TraG/TraD family ATPase VirD4 n=1 Tax=Actinopolymorpha pittospori TaxID=648752 RepID=A0A927R7G4_9ACTN|nr:TraM recognition domain-containing protein [Actinopolymorpha pittospori]MBE1605552.1 type IV secretory pathway TraG/TraD family ATPase VirD4 [Actinopolymorpha pittospori]